MNLRRTELPLCLSVSTATKATDTACRFNRRPLASSDLHQDLLWRLFENQPVRYWKDPCCGPACCGVMGALRAGAPQIFNRLQLFRFRTARFSPLALPTPFSRDQEQETTKLCAQHFRCGTSLSRVRETSQTSLSNQSMVYKISRQADTAVVEEIILLHFNKLVQLRDRSEMTRSHLVGPPPLQKQLVNYLAMEDIPDD